MQFLNERELIVLLWEQLAGYGVKSSYDVHPDDHFRADAVLALTRGESNQRYLLELKSRPTLTNIRMRPDTSDLPLLVGGIHINPRTADAFRLAGIQFIDVAGNASIAFGDVLIDVRGRRPPTDLEQHREAPTGNLFSSARAQVIFALLQWPKLWGSPQRELAAAAGVSLGQANSTLAALEKAGFGPTGHRNDRELLDLWAGAFPGGLGSKLTMAEYHGNADEIENPSTSDTVFVSGEAAVPSLLTPVGAVVYVPELDPMLAVKNRWRSDGPPNIIVRRKFWTTPANAVGQEQQVPDNLTRAPELLVYADLLSSNDPRVQEAARDWRAHHAELL